MPASTPRGPGRAYADQVERVSAWRRGVNALPRLVADAPPIVLIGVGGVALLLGALIVTRPLTSLVLLTVYVGLSALIFGLVQFAAPHQERGWAARIFAGLWVVLGLAMLFGLGRTLELIPVALAVLLLVGGAQALVDAIVDGTVSQRVLWAASGTAQIVFGVLSLTWPDVTVLVVAVVFGVRTLAFGVSTVVRGAVLFSRAPHERDADLFARSALSIEEVYDRRARGWAAAGRYALAAVLVTVSVAGWWLSDWLRDGAPVVDAFYDPPAVVPYDHGQLIREGGFSGQQPEGTEVRRILYTTRDALGQPAVGSALVISPSDPPRGPRPVILWNHGTTGVAQGCAPSLRDASATKWAVPSLDEVIDNGWVVVAPDYSGQGAPGVFPYLIGLGEARSSLDAVVAARALEDLMLSTRTVVWGHSQGGHAALWASQIADGYTPGLDVLGTAALSPAADPHALATELLRDSATVELSILISWVLVPYADTYDDVDLARYVAPGGEAIVREMTQRCPSEPGVVVSVATALGVSEDRPLYVENLAAGPLGQRLRENAPQGPWGTPMLIAWGADDEVISPELQEWFVADLCEQGEDVRYLEYVGYDHLGIMLPRSAFLPVLMRWTEDRFDLRQPARNDCEAKPLGD